MLIYEKLKKYYTIINYNNNKNIKTINIKINFKNAYWHIVYIDKNIITTYAYY